ncbi:MAG TPA: hypothetical protein VF532_15925 [Candidatus Angelobacter sp.]
MVPEPSEVRWLAPSENPWNIRLLDVRAVTQHLISTSQDPQCAANAISYGRDDGSAFLAQEPTAARFFTANLLYRTDGPLGEGALFRPAVMEHKWAIFHQQNKLLFVRSWQRKVFVVADVEQRGGLLAVGVALGAFVDENEPPEFSVRALDYLMRSHALEEIYPAPLLPGLLADANADGDLHRAALWCFGAFGNMALFAAAVRPNHDIPEQPLRIR